MAGNLIYVGIVLLIIGIIAYLLGARGIGGMSAGLGRTILIIGVVLFLIFLLLRVVGVGV